MNYNAVRICLFAIFPLLVLAGVFWGYLGFNIPPLNGAVSAEELSEHFITHQTRLKIAYGVAIPSWSLLMVWSVGVFGVMRRIEGPNGVYSYVQLVGGALTTLVPSLATVFLLVAAYRPEADPQIIRMLFDASWLMIDLVFGVTTIQYLAIAAVFVADKRPVRIVPSWVSWLGVLIGIEFVMELIMPFFRSGPFSWSGVFNYWIPFFGPFIWMMILTCYLLSGINRLEAEDAS
ncbi:MAG: hypothetical protein ACJAWI_000047 [Marinomonas primoryensis]|jgi:hypothetical protein